ncbi:MAG: PAS domain-containing protein, partial [candidate division Zixibacteria bacterium]|nr:PAS domain-containing protein [candidate division Zixibacteria bacterium]NIR63918.1 PAS domain-containing protein [candidate division Zixibacteria bacterium]NIS15058.1 PAS domain-containing protein [candidate division Zixibacteria bacterium]NIS45835.1 PAS domain-containing protein [candidate division Zixibacteria bacterium]NIT51568.1 PAS domain-containing protein [candidate division Zixibacteria bacterium]
FNRAAEQITSIPREEAIGQRCCDVFRASICESSCALRETFRTGEPVVNKAVFIIDASGRKIPISISAAVLRNKDGEIIGGVETFRDLSALEELKRELEKKYSFQDIISKNSAMLKIFDILPSIAESESTVLIEGDSGTGKELIARAIHNLSNRRDHPIITINCGALPDTLLESELFGHKAGAFTDARKDKPGRFALAEGGTIFLDEIADTSPSLQVKLLRVIQEKVYEPLGGTESVEANVRIITASNRNLQKLVKAGRFREDLFYRINVITIKLPPLRERKEDIPLLVNHFINRFNNLKDRIITEVSPDVMAILMSHDYPGNIRELENIIEHAFVLCKGTVINLECLPDSIRPKDKGREIVSHSLEEMEAAYLKEALRKNN